MTAADSIGWAATAVFTASYLAKEHATLRRVQMAGASLWLAYGLVMQALPVVVANALVLSAACWSEYRHMRRFPARETSVSTTRTGAGHVEAA